MDKTTKYGLAFGYEDANKVELTNLYALKLGGSQKRNKHYDLTYLIQ